MKTDTAKQIVKDRLMFNDSTFRTALEMLLLELEELERYRQLGTVESLKSRLELDDVSKY